MATNNIIRKKADIGDDLFASILGNYSKKINAIKNENNVTNANEVTSNIKDECSTFQSTFKDDLKSLFNDSTFHDVKFCIGAEIIRAHKDILRARSPVFKRMFDTDMKEKISECINITDLNLDTLKRMLIFIYTDTIEELEFQTAKELYFASDKYDITSLKKRCSIFLKQKLHPSNVCELLVLADMHHDEELKSNVQEYILKHGQQVFVSDEWKSFMESNSYLAAQVMYLKCLKK